jgi:ribosomal protein S12 methylthiotransferase accessory factor
MRREETMEFAAGADLYEAIADGRAGSARGAEAARLLADLGYLEGPAGRPASGDGANRLALLRLAARSKRTFHLPLPHLPGASFLGAQFALSPFGFEGHEIARVNAGGRGWHLGEAFESCMGEAAEHLSMLVRPDDPRIAHIAEEPEVPQAIRAWVNAGLGHEPVAAWRGEPGVVAESLIDGCRQMLPAELVLRPPPGRRRAGRQAETTGLAAGATREAALAAGLLEVIERDAVALWWYGGNRAVRIEAAPALWPALAGRVATAGRDNERPHWFLDISADIAVPVIACLSAGRGGEAVVMGSAAHLDAERAAERAFLEMAQMELAQELALLKQAQEGDAALTAGDRAWIGRSQGLTLERFPRAWGIEAEGPPRSGPRAVAYPLATIIEVLGANGFAPLALDLTLGNVGITVTRVVVPGLQSVRPDWTSPRLERAAEANGVDLALRQYDLAPI